MKTDPKGYFKEDGKTFYSWGNGHLERSHDDNFNGMRFAHRRCPFCDRITSEHSLHWLNHLRSCAPVFYTINNLLEMRYREPKDIHYVDETHIRS